MAWLLLGIVAGLAYRTFADYGLGWDDYTHSQYGQLLLDYYASGLADKRALSFVNLYMYGGGFDMLAALVAKVLPYDLFETRRLVGAAVGIAGMVIVWRLARRLGGPAAGLIALALLALAPLYYGHMFINAKDVPFAVAMTLLLFGLVRAIEDYPRPRIVTVVIVGIGLGLALGTRIMGGMTALYMVPAMAMLISHDFRIGGWRAAARALGVFVMRLAPGLLLAYAVMAVVWPWSVQEPLNPVRAIGYFSHFFEKPWREMFAGRPILVPDMPHSYLPTYLALKLPEVLLLLGGAGLIGALAAQFCRDMPIRRRAALLLVAMAFIVPVAIAIATRPAMYNGIRHFAFVLPPLCVLGGWAAAGMLRWLSRHSRPAAAAGAVAIAAGLSLPAYHMVTLHPYQYTFFNTSSGGVRAADRGYMLDYWGLSFKEAADELLGILDETGNHTPEGRRWVIAVCGPHPPAALELGEDFLTTWNTKGADFALMLGEFYCAELNAPELVRIEREGVVYARVYDLRGRNIPDLFTLPPVQ
ncbi:glycosyltransferase family 39 protein [Pseudorhodoplanes sp.]|uniref:glycosyltransferase family 39 protein n=1 Tax=Pseudorhodoplanes sp. TaxID=1934341 RepID=UPI00391A9AAE